MSTVQNIKSKLVDADDSVLIVIDIQDSFLQKYDNARSQEVVAKVVWLLHSAKLMNVPVVAMAEDIEFSGNLNQQVHDALPDGTIVHDKDAFCLTDNSQILDAVKVTGRKTAVLVGMETDVCVAHSALGLVGHGYQVVVIKDAVVTTASDEEIGLSRMREAGVAVCSVKSLYFEWVRSVSNVKGLLEMAPELEDALLPSSLVL
jgi:nicotinamidase-related amidase